MANMPASVHTLRISAPRQCILRTTYIHTGAQPALGSVKRTEGSVIKVAVPVLLGQRRARSSKRMSLSTLMERA